MAIEEEEEVESCGSRVFSSQPQPQPPLHQRQKLEMYNEVLRRIQDSNWEEATLPDFDDHLWLHFNRLPARYPTLLFFSFFPANFLSIRKNRARKVKIPTIPL